MNDRKEVLSFMVYMWNAWSKTEAAIVFNGKNNSNDDSWNFSLGEHIWNKWLNFCNDHGAIGAAEYLIANIDEDCINKLVERACSLYYGRKNK